MYSINTKSVYITLLLLCSALLPAHSNIRIATIIQYESINNTCMYTLKAI